MSVFVSIFCYINFAQKCDLYHSLTYIDFFSFFIMHFLAKKYRNFRLNSHISSCGIWKFQRNTFLFSFLFLIFPSLLTLKLPPHSFSDSLPSVCTPPPPSLSLHAAHAQKLLNLCWYISFLTFVTLLTGPQRESLWQWVICCWTPSLCLCHILVPLPLTAYSRGTPAHEHTSVHARAHTD